MNNSDLNLYRLNIKTIENVDVHIVILMSL